MEMEREGSINMKVQSARSWRQDAKLMEKESWLTSSFLSLARGWLGTPLLRWGDLKEEKEETVMGSELEGRKDEGSFGCVELLLYFFSLKRKEKFY